MKVYIIPCHIIGYINVMLFVQSCTDSLQVLPDSSSDTFPMSSYGTCTKVEEDIDMEEEKEEVNANVKTEKGISSEEEECIDIKDEEGIYSEEEEEGNLDTKEDVDVDVKEKVSGEDKV